MDYEVIGKSHLRRDAEAKVTGRADYTADIPMKGMYHGRICRAKIAHGFVSRLDLSEALRVEGVIRILTPDDLPDVKFPTAGHPYALTEKGGDVYDKNILTRKVRHYGDEIAAVIAETELAASIAVSKIEAEYERLPFYLTCREALEQGAAEIHEGTGNVIASTETVVGDIEKGFSRADRIIEAEYHTQTVQHCHIENQAAIAYKGNDGRWVCVSSTQIPHICRRIIGQALEIPWGGIRVIKPFVGGGFGNKQDVTIEPLAVAMSMAVNGAPVKLALTREESMAYTRVRHAISYKARCGVTNDGSIVALEMDACSNNGAYASHGHSVVIKGAGMIQALYTIPNMVYNAKTVYTNTASAGAMRGYGVPQVTFAMEALIEKICAEAGFDPFEFRLANFTYEGWYNPVNEIIQHNNRIAECLKRGRKAFEWDRKAKEAEVARGNGALRGVGVAAFGYTSGVYPKGHEIAGCRLVLNQDGSIRLMLGAAEIGQGADTVFGQMVAETVGVPFEQVYTDDRTDTDIAPFDTGAYASRQSYVTGMAVKRAAEELREKILKAAKVFCGEEPHLITIKGGEIVFRHNGRRITTLGELALKTYYDWDKAECITADVSVNCHDNSYPMGVTFAEVELDADTGKPAILSLLNVHDSGVILNPLLASGQVEGGMGMGVGYALGEQLKYDPETGKPLNNNLLDYKMPTFMDIPELDVLFVESEDPIGPYGNKGLGEPPLCSPAIAIRNAIVNAAGVELNSLPLSSQRIFEAISATKP